MSRPGREYSKSELLLALDHLMRARSTWRRRARIAVATAFVVGLLGGLCIGVRFGLSLTTTPPLVVRSSP